MFLYRKCGHIFVVVFHNGMTLVNMARLFRAIVEQPSRIVFFCLLFVSYFKKYPKSISPASLRKYCCVYLLFCHQPYWFGFFLNHLKHDVKKRKFIVNLAVLLAVARNCMCRSVHGLLWNKQVWIKQLAVEGAKAMRPYWLTHRLVLADANLIDSLLVSFKMNVTKKFNLEEEIMFQAKKLKIFIFRCVTCNSP